MEKGNRNQLSMIWLLILFAWFLDVITTLLGISMKIKEGSNLFLTMPFMWVALFLGLSTLVYFFRWAPAKLRKIILLGIVVGSFIPAINNIVAIYLMVMI